MTDLMSDSFDVPSIGRQHDSRKETMPAFSFTTALRDKVMHKTGLNSPGPVYRVPSTVGDGPRWAFGTEERVHGKAPYPDTSVDLTCATVDSQTTKYPSTKGVHFGTEPRLHSKNAEALRSNPEAMHGMCSPPGFDYTPEDHMTSKAVPIYSFGPRSGRLGEKTPPRITLPPGGTPRHVGPGSHSQPPGLGNQPNSARKSAPAWTFGGRRRSLTPREDRVLLDPAPDLSSLGRQVVSTARSAPKCDFGKSTREQAARTYLLQTGADKGPAAVLPKPKFNLELPPPPVRPVRMAGM